MSEFMHTPSGPRSYNEYLSANGLDDTHEAIQGFTQELTAYQAEVAAQLGITEDELHWLGNDAIQAALGERHATAA